MKGSNSQSQPTNDISSPSQESIVTVSQESKFDMQKKSKLLRIFICLLASVVLIATGAFGFWFYQEKIAKKQMPSVIPPISPVPSPTPTSVVKAGWEAYQDENFGYSLQYPNSWFLDTEVVELGGGQPLLQKSTQILWITTHEDIPGVQAGDLGERDKVRLGVIYIENKEGDSLKEQMRKHVQPDFVDDPPENIESTWITIDGLEAHRYIYYPNNKWASPGVYTTIRLKNDDFMRVDAIILHDFDNYLNQVIDIQDSFKTL